MKIESDHKKRTPAVELKPKETRLLNMAPSPSKPEAFGIKIKKILVPIDFSDCSKRALHSAIGFARQYGAEITLLAVVPDERTSFDYGEAEYVSWLERRQEGYERELRKLIDTMNVDVPLHPLVKTGRPFQEIVCAAKSLNADVIVISTHSERGLFSATLGSTTERVIRYASCPVIVVREKGRDLVSASSAECKNPETMSKPAASKPRP